jgi:hypothetical protein
LLVKTGIDKDGVAGTVERGTVVVSSFSCGVTVLLEREVNDSGKMGVDVDRATLVRENELAVCAIVSVELLFCIREVAVESNGVTGE